MTPNEETLMAYADGELDAERKAAVEAALAADPALAERVEAHRALRARLGAAFGPAEGQGSDPLEAMIRGTAPAQVVDLAAVRAAKAPPEPAPKRPVPRWAAWAGVAAALVLAVVVIRPVLPGVGGGAPGPIVSRDGRLVAEGQLVRVLDTQLASEPPAGAAIRVGLTFRAQDGRYCRTFQPAAGQGLAGVACRDGRDWTVRMATETDVGSSGGYRTAASATPQPVLDAVQGLIAGEPFDAAAEKKARGQRWSR